MGKIKEALNSNVVRGSRGMMLMLALTGVLGLATFSLGSKAILSYNEAQDVKAQTAEMHDTIDKWKQQTALIENEPYRPVAKKQVDTVNSDMLFKMQANHLAMSDYKAVNITDKDAQNKRTFSLSFKGQYADTIHFLSDFHSRDALINMLSLKLSPKDGLIDGRIVYRIYVK